MFISSAFAHGSNNDGEVGGMMPLVVIGVVVVFALYMIVKWQWRKYRARRNTSPEYPAE